MDTVSFGKPTVAESEVVPAASVGRYRIEIAYQRQQKLRESLDRELAEQEPFHRRCLFRIQVEHDGNNSNIWICRPDRAKAERPTPDHTLF